MDQPESVYPSIGVSPCQFISSPESIAPATGVGGVSYFALLARESKDHEAPAASGCSVWARIRPTASSAAWTTAPSRARGPCGWSPSRSWKEARSSSTTMISALSTAGTACGGQALEFGAPPPRRRIRANGMEREWNGARMEWSANGMVQYRFAPPFIRAAINPVSPHGFATYRARPQHAEGQRHQVAPQDRLSQQDDRDQKDPPRRRAPCHGRETERQRHKPDVPARPADGGQEHQRGKRRAPESHHRPLVLQRPGVEQRRLANSPLELHRTAAKTIASRPCLDIRSAGGKDAACCREPRQTAAARKRSVSVTGPNKTGTGSRPVPKGA